MLGQRVRTALILIPLVIASVLYLPTEALASVFALAVAIAAVEWAHLAGVAQKSRCYLYALALLVILALLLVTGWVSRWQLPMAAAASLWWLLVTLMLWRYRPGQSAVAGTALKLLFGVIVLVPAWAALVALHGQAQGPLLVIYLMVLIWVADSAAYFSGRRWGQVKLAPAVSPGKTREGVYGALVGAALCGLLLGVAYPGIAPLVALVLISVVVALVSVVGDLLESLMKRQSGIKDSGQLLPGHGGMFDRIDSLTAAAPLFLFALLLAGEGR